MKLKNIMSLEKEFKQPKDKNNKNHIHGDDPCHIYL
ncbi:hypothetical protein PFUGPA_05240 [Plasmodium falciparum Palo Alto/Uganda]|uniref:Uncharacterized protein n=1 Tax=Plasmodium falciparum (isolate Palo Alto / Uganda) TaxID=57270 RepID=W4ISL2_PLAFP|nr:hypothetical protein PFUGPA_05240 [Plasmodium falciparum Palo Alto/Uganda]